MKSYYISYALWKQLDSNTKLFSTKIEDVIVESEVDLTKNFPKAKKILEATKNVLAIINVTEVLSAQEGTARDKPIVVGLASATPIIVADEITQLREFNGAILCRHYHVNKDYIITQSGFQWKYAVTLGDIEAVYSGKMLFENAIMYAKDGVLYKGISNRE